MCAAVFQQADEVRDVLGPGLARRGLARVVGFYDQPVATSAAWAGSDPFDGGPSPVGALDRLDTVLADISAAVARLTGR